jgi:hypothetical protein
MGARLLLGKEIIAVLSIYLGTRRLPLKFDAAAQESQEENRGLEKMSFNALSAIIALPLRLRLENIREVFSLEAK